MGSVQAARVTVAITWFLVAESLIYGLSALPGLLTFRFLLNLPIPLRGQYIETALVGVAIVPAYLVFCVALMFFTGLAARVFRWRAVPGEYLLRERGWPLLRWALYNGSIHLVRLFAGGVLRATPLWTWFLRWNGATVGRNVHVNSVNVYDHNLLTLGDDVVVGSDVKMSAHTGERSRLLIAPIQLGRGVTVGTNSIVYAGVTIGDEAQVAAMSLVPKGAQLEAGGVYAGVPVQLVKRAPTAREPLAANDPHRPLAPSAAAPD